MIEIYARKGKEKKMKKIVALLLAAVMMLSLSACGKPDIQGVYSAELDITDIIAESFDEGADMGEGMPSIREYLGTVSITMICEFNEDGTYSQYTDMQSAKRAMESFNAAAVKYLDDMVFLLLKEEIALQGQIVNSREDIEGLIGMSWDDLFVTALGTDIETAVDELFEEALPIEVFDEDLKREGKYKAEKGKLYRSDSLSESVGSGYETYELDGDTVVLTGGYNVMTIDEIVYPVTLVKVK